jgi:hypothetical protein
LRVQVKATGATVWKNPKGYLPGEKQPLLPFHAAISLLYIMLAATWLSLNLLNSSHTCAQHFVTLCVFLGMLESCMDYAEVYSVNSKGILRPQLAMAAAIVACTFKACTRVIVLLLAGGIGILRPYSVDRQVVLLGAPLKTPYCSITMRWKRLMIHGTNHSAIFSALMVKGLELTINQHHICSPL